MARVTARQAFTRARTKRMRTRAETNKALVQQKIVYNQLLRDIFADVKAPPARAANKRQSKNLAHDKLKKITDYFASTNRLEFKPITKMSKTSSCVDSNGVEVITLYESDCDCDSNNNSSTIENDPQNINRSLTEAIDGLVKDTKPGHSDLSHLGASFQDLDLKLKVDEDVEIVEMLPPIPLRNHPVHEIDDS